MGGGADQEETPLDGKKREGPRRKRDKDDKGWQKKGKRKFCIFCKERIDYVDYKDVMTLRKFVSRPGQDPRPTRHGQLRAAPA